MTLQWNEVKSRGVDDTRVFRADVPGGWLVLVERQSGSADAPANAHYTNALTFVPDPAGDWLSAATRW